MSKTQRSKSSVKSRNKSLADNTHLFKRLPELRPIGRTSLHRCSNRAEAEYLLKQAPDMLDAVDNVGRTPLMTAAAHCAITVVELLTERGASVNTCDNDGRTALHYAAACGNAELIDILHSAGSQLLATDRQGATPLHCAVLACSNAAAAAAAEETATGDGDETTHGRCDPFSSQLPRSSGSSSSSNVVNKAVEALDKLVSLLDGQLNNTDQYGRTALVWAVSLGCPIACQVLLKAGADIMCSDVDGITALHCAVKVKDTTCTQLLVKGGAYIDEEDVDGCTALFYAADAGNATSARLLLAAGAEADHQDHKGTSAAHCAARRGSMDCLQCLRDFGANLWLPNSTGDLPVHEAACRMQTDTVSYLLFVGGIDGAVDAANSMGRTCLHIAAMTDNAPLIALLVKQYGASVDARMMYKGTTMTAADIARMSHKEFCASTIERCHEELQQDPELMRIAAENNRWWKQPEIRDMATQTEDWSPATTTVDQSVQYSSDGDVTETPAVIPPPGIDASTSTSAESVVRPRKTASRRQQRALMSRDELIQAQVKAYEAARAASVGLQAARLEQIRSAYGVRTESRAQSGGAGSGSQCGSAFPPRIAAIGREQTVTGCLERTYNRAVSITSARNASSTDFRIRPGSCRLLGDFTLTMQAQLEKALKCQRLYKREEKLMY